MGCGITRGKRNSDSRDKVAEVSSKVSLGSFIRVSSEDQKGKFKMLKKLGSGSYSSVFLCLKKSNCQRTALKVIQKGCLSDDMLDNEVKCKEAAILRELDHPNIIKCFEIFEDASHIILSEEFIKGGNLYTYQKSKLPVSTVANIMSQLLSALVYCHERQIVHRDIKLENIFIAPGKDIQIKLGDFGFATKMNPNEPLNGCCGTLVYIAPEVFTGNYNEKVDIWSCGVLLYILMTGNSPYNAPNSEALKRQVEKFPLNCKKKDIQALGSEFVEFLDGFLKVNPKERFSAQEALKHPWLKKFMKHEIEDHEKFVQKIMAIPRKSLMQKSISIYINAFFADEKYLDELSKYFKMIDKDCNGTIDKFELINELNFVLDHERSIQIAEDFFINFDLNCNGVIDYMEFLAAFCLEDLVLSEENLEKVFMEVDKSKRGFVTQTEIEEFLGIKFDSFSTKTKAEPAIGKKIRLDEFKLLAKKHTQ